ncbi:hypothetical protein GCM10023107_75440 [Actinoplanes octamycinicus]|nr:hypothetical protein Aoc01nite_52870 [Actinoplanes octamycinicus]
MDPWSTHRWWGHEAQIPPTETHLWLPDLLPPASPPAQPRTLAEIERSTRERLLADPAARRRCRQELRDRRRSRCLPATALGTGSNRIQRAFSAA